MLLAILQVRICKMKKIFLFLFLVATSLFGNSEYNVLISEKTPAGYDAEVYKKAIVLMTEGRLYLQEKFKKKLTFIYSKNLVTEKNAIEKELEKNGAQFYVYLTIDKKETNDNLENCLYNLEIYNLENKRKKTIKTKAVIRDKQIVQIEFGDLKSSAKNIANVFK